MCVLFKLRKGQVQNQATASSIAQNVYVNSNGNHLDMC